MGSHTSVHDSFLSDFMEVWIRESTGSLMVRGSRKMDEAHAEGLKEGKLRGLRMGLAMYANELRRAKWRALNIPEAPEDNSDHRALSRTWVPSMYDTAFVQWLNNVTTDWEGGRWKDATDKEFFLAMRSEFMALVFNEDFENSYLYARKDAVKAGFIPPAEEDREWIEEEHKAFQAMATPLADLLNKIKS